MTVVSGQTYADLLARCETAEYHLSIAQTLAKQAEMTLRDQFAMVALAGLIQPGRIDEPDLIAREAYVYADQMMFARAKEPAK